MPVISFADFKGRIPRLTARRLPQVYGQVAINCEFEQGSLKPIRQPRLVHTLDADAQTIYRLDGAWLSWDAIVDVARAPVAANRIYYTGDGVPKVRDGGNVYPLALPAPVSPPSVVNLSAHDPEFAETILFCYTWVTSLGEESAPSPVSTAIEWSPGVVTRVQGFASPPAGRAIVARRIYRSQTSATGVTGFFLAAEIPVTTTSIDYDIAATPLQEPLPSADYDTPPDTLIGLVSMPNGMMAAFTGNELCFCEPYKPHAWPEKYRLTVDYPIVGLATFGSAVAILTAGTPYIAQGITPDAMAMEKMETGVPCRSRRGIVDLGYSALYPSTEGLALISPTETRLITSTMLTLDQWRAYTPESIIAQRYRGRYLFLYAMEAITVYIGGPAAGWPEPGRTNLEGGGAVADPDALFLIGGGADSVIGPRQFASIDLENDQPSLTDITFVVPFAVYRDETGADTYFLDADKRSIYAWADRARNFSTLTWRSKPVGTLVPVSFGAIFVRTEAPLITGETCTVRVYGDGVLIASVSVTNAIARLPASRMALEWEVEIETNTVVVWVAMAGTPEELMAAAP